MGDRADPRDSGCRPRGEVAEALVEIVDTESTDVDRERPASAFLISSSSCSSSSLFLARSASLLASSASAKPFLQVLCQQLAQPCSHHERGASAPPLGSV